jgi:hypothetical protein
MERLVFGQFAFAGKLSQVLVRPLVVCGYVVGNGPRSSSLGGRAVRLRRQAGRARTDADHGRRQRPAGWAAAVSCAVRVLEEQSQAGVLMYCTAGRRRSAMLVFAVLRLRGHDQTAAAELALCPPAPAAFRSRQEAATSSRWDVG